MANMANFKLPSESGVRHLPRPSGPFCVGWVDVFTAGRGEVTAGLLLRLYYPAPAPAPAPAPGSEATPTDGWARWFPLPQYAEGFFNFDIEIDVMYMASNSAVFLLPTPTIAFSILESC